MRSAVPIRTDAEAPKSISSIQSATKQDARQMGYFDFGVVWRDPVADQTKGNGQFLEVMDRLVGTMFPEAKPCIQTSWTRADNGHGVFVALHIVL